MTTSTHNFKQTRTHSLPPSLTHKHTHACTGVEARRLFERKLVPCQTAGVFSVPPRLKQAHRQHQSQWNQRHGLASPRGCPGWWSGTSQPGARCQHARACCVANVKQQGGGVGAMRACMRMCPCASLSLSLCLCLSLSLSVCLSLSLFQSNKRKAAKGTCSLPWHPPCSDQSWQPGPG